MKIKHLIKLFFFFILRLLKYEEYVKNRIIQDKNNPFLVLKRLLQEEIIFIDVGANEGQTIDIIANIFPKADIYSFEPTLELRAKLKKKYVNNNKVHLNFLGLSNYEGKSIFFTSEHSATNSILDPNVALYEKFNHPITNILRKKQLYEINVTTLSNWYRYNRELGIVDVLKIDTQGSEFLILEGSKDIFDKIKIVLFEIQFEQFYLDSPLFTKSFELLYKHSFYLLDFYNISRINGLLIECDVIFLNKKYFPLENVNVIDKPNEK